MTHILDNPFWHAMNTFHAHLCEGNDRVKRYIPAVSPIAAVAEEKSSMFDDLVKITSPGDGLAIGTNSPEITPSHPSLEVLLTGQFIQMMFEGESSDVPDDVDDSQIVDLTTANVPEMMELVELTRPGPFAERTIELGDYYGIFQDGQLVSMAGERCRVPGYTEISAVCTRPGYEGRGYASKLMTRLMHNMFDRDETPFLHVLATNERAIAVYKRYGFRKRHQRNLFFMRRI